MVDRIPPQNIEMEQATLGAMLMSKAAIEAVTEILSAEAFYRDAHRDVYNAILSVSEDYAEVDPFSVQEALKKANALESSGGAPYLGHLMQFCSAPANAEFYAKAVHECFTRRKLLDTANRIQSLAHDVNMNIDAIADESIASLSTALAAGGTALEIVSPEEGTNALFDRIEYAMENRGKIYGLSSGYSDMDWHINGIKKNHMIVIAARPSVGKSSLLLAIAEHIASTHGPVLYFSLEMSSEELYTRRISMMAQVDSHRIESGWLDDEEIIRVNNQGSKLKKIPLHIISKGGITVSQVSRMAEQWKRKNIQAVVVDYLQLMKPASRNGNRVTEVSEIARGLKEIAMKLEIPVITAAQLNRQIEGADRTPRLSDIRECGEIENSADIVAALNDPDSKSDRNKSREIELHMLKVRGGKLGVVKLWWEPQFTRFATIAKGY